MSEFADSQRIKVTNWHGRPRCYVSQYCTLTVNNVNALGDHPLCYELLMKSCLMQRGLVIPYTIVNKSLLRHSSVSLHIQIHIMCMHMVSMYISAYYIRRLQERKVVLYINNRRQLGTWSQSTRRSLKDREITLRFDTLWNFV